MKGTKLIFLAAFCLLMAPGGRPLSAQEAGASNPAESLGVLVHQMHRMDLPDEGQAWLGVELADVTQAKVTELKLPGDYGAIVAHVVENSPAAKAGLKVNDVILEFGGMRVWSAAQLKQWVDETPPGRNVDLRISRNGQKLTLQVTMEPLRMHAMALPPFNIPSINIPSRFFQFAPFEMRGRLGIEAQDLTPQLANYFGVKQGRGMLVEDVEAGSPAAKAGLKAGDCIVRVDSTEVDTMSNLRSALREKSEGGRTVTLAIVRKGHEELLHVNLQPSWTPNPEHEAENLTGGAESQIQEIEKEIPRIQRQERQLEACLQALETHIFALQARPIQKNTAMVRGPQGGWMVTGPGCPRGGAESGD